MGEHAAAAPDPGVVEKQLNLVGAVTLADLVAKSLDLRRVGHVSDVRRDPQALRQPRRIAEPAGFRHAPFGNIAHRDIAGLSG